MTTRSVMSSIPWPVSARPPTRASQQVGSPAVPQSTSVTPCSAPASTTTLTWLIPGQTSGSRRFHSPGRTSNTATAVGSIERMSGVGPTTTPCYCSRGAKIKQSFDSLEHPHEEEPDERARTTVGRADRPERQGRDRHRRGAGPRLRGRPPPCRSRRCRRRQRSRRRPCPAKQWTGSAPRAAAATAAAGDVSAACRTPRPSWRRRSLPTDGSTSSSTTPASGR